MKSRFMFVVVSLLVVAMLLSACGPAATPAPTQAPAKPTEVKINNPPMAAAEVDAIELKGKNVTVTYWHNRPQKDQDFLQGMLDEFNKSNPYGITA